ncbi:helix-turn-helix domain-containing protein [Paenibacillus guangzhouensis]|uniref:helix-turn-helix domain-containing protein n=1 Tax=Paenibacillus guangzhouensis TaxID=1473112 RepID=UPI0012670277|nr:helix-turn-helix domain-containing protein [Paenibacillus guangzhouensis]
MTRSEQQPDKMNLNEGSAMAGLMFRLRDAACLQGGALSIPPQLTQSYVLIYIRQGQGSVTIGETMHRMQSHAIYFCPADDTFSVDSDEGIDTELYLFRMDIYQEQGGFKRRLYPLRGELQLCKGEAATLPSDTLVPLCESVLHYHESQDPLERFRSQFTFEQLLYHVMQCYRMKQQPSGSTLEQVRMHMERHLDQSMTIEQLARRMDLSPKYFGDVFKKHYGMSPMDYLTELRMNRAKLLMAKPNLKLRDIAHQVGYQDEFYFSRKFKKEIGVAPTVYMKRRHRRVAAYSLNMIGLLLPLQIIPFAAPLHPKWTSHYYRTYHADIPVHLRAYRQHDASSSKIQELQAHRPELILCPSEVSEEEKLQLEQIATVYYIPAQGLSWREQLMLTAELLGETEEAEVWLKKYERQAVRAREQLHAIVQEGTCLVIRITRNAIYAYSNRAIAEVFYGDLQMKPLSIYSEALYEERLTLDALSNLDVDHLFVLVQQEEETLQHWETMQYDPRWQEMKSVRLHHFYRLNSDPWRHYTADAMERVVKETLHLVSGNRP